MTHTEDRKTASIERSLKQTAGEIQSLKQAVRRGDMALPASADHIARRLQAIRHELDTVSDKMLAYKLRRLADSKILQSVSAATHTPSPAAAKQKVSPRQSTGGNSEYHSPTFRCKSDLDTCLLQAGSALDKALCYALFIRCAIKG